MRLFRAPPVFFADTVSPRLSSTLDACRWAAAVLVLIFHIRVNLFAPVPQFTSGVSWFFWTIFASISNCGHQAVLWFFVLSGYLVGGGIVADVRGNRFSVGRYAINRIARVYVVLVPALTIGFGWDAVRIALHGISFAGSETAASFTIVTFVGNILNLETLIVPTFGSNNPLWSLAYEAWYYVLAPLFLAPFISWRGLSGRWLPLLAGIAITGWLFHHNPQILRLGLVWALGIAIRFIPQPIVHHQRIALLFAVVAMLVYAPLFDRIGNLATLPVVLVFANFLLTVKHSQLVSAIPGAKICAILAGFSYSLYLTHAPFLHFMLPVLGGQDDPMLSLQPSSSLLINGLTVFAGAIGYAYLFSRATEDRTAEFRALLSRTLNIPYVAAR